MVSHHKMRLIPGRWEAVFMTLAVESRNEAGSDAEDIHRDVDGTECIS